MKQHVLKIWPGYFDRIDSKQKTFEVRKNDRDFQVGDELILREYNPKTETYTGRELFKKVSYILHGGEFGIDKGYVVMALEIFY